MCRANTEGSAKQTLAEDCNEQMTKYWHSKK